jgi:peroxiredoxin
MRLGRKQRLPEPGAAAPDFRLERLNGGEASPASLAAGGPFLLAFFKVTCPVCQYTLPFLERIHRAGGLRVFGVSQNDAEDTQDFNRHYGITFPTLLDPEGRFPASNSYGISTVPTLVLVGADGTVSRVVEGWRKAEVGWLAAQAGLEVFRAGEKIADWKAG